MSAFIMSRSWGRSFVDGSSMRGNGMQGRRDVERVIMRSVSHS